MPFIPPVVPPGAGGPAGPALPLPLELQVAALQAQLDALAAQLDALAAAAAAPPEGGYQENLRFPYRGGDPADARERTYLRSGIVELPFDWDAPENLRDPANPATKPGHPVILAFGGNDGRDFAEQAQLQVDLPGGDPWRHAIVLYLDPLTLGGSNQKWNPGHVGETGYYVDPDDVGFVVTALHRVRLMLQARLDARSAAGDTPYEVFDPARIYLVGFSVGACMCYRLAAEAPLVHPEDPGYVYAFNALFVVAGTVGGYRHGAEFDGWWTTTPAMMRYDWAPGVDCSRTAWHTAKDAIGLPLPTGMTRIFHVHGELDPSVGTRAAVLATAPWFPAVPWPNAGGPTDDTVLVAGFEQSLVVGMNQYENYRDVNYSEATALHYARWDLIAEYGVWRWEDHHASQLAGTNAILFGPLMIEDAGAAAILIPAPLDAYGIGTGWLWAGASTSAGGNPNVRLLVVEGMGHAWPAWKVRTLIFDFFDDLV